MLKFHYNKSINFGLFKENFFQIELFDHKLRVKKWLLFNWIVCDT